MYSFFLNYWKYRTHEQASEEDIYKAVEKGRITEEEYQEIINTPKEV